MLKRNDSIIIAGHLYFMVLVMFTVLFAEDRLCRDPGYYLMRIINERWFVVDHYRYTSILNQALAVAGVRLQLPLQWLVVLNSISDYLFYYGIFLLLAYYFKNAKYLFIYLICLSTGTDYLFFVPGTFLLMSVATMMIFFATLEQVETFRPKHWLFLLFLLAFALFSYPTSFLPMLFLLFLLFQQKKIPSRTFLILALCTIIILGLKSFLKDPYESDMIRFAFGKQHYHTMMSEIRSASIIKEFLTEYFVILWPVVFLFIGSVIICIVSKRYIQLFAGVLFILSMFMLFFYCNSYHVPDAYFERLQYVIVPIIVGWFVLNIEPFKKVGLLMKIAIPLLLVYNACNTFKAHILYHQRIEK